MEGGSSSNPINVDSNNTYGGYDSGAGNAFTDSMVPYLNESLKVGPESRRDPNA